MACGLHPFNEACTTGRHPLMARTSSHPSLGYALPAGSMDSKSSSMECRKALRQLMPVSATRLVYANWHPSRPNQQQRPYRFQSLLCLRSARNLAKGTRRAQRIACLLGAKAVGLDYAPTPPRKPNMWLRTTHRTRRQTPSNRE